MYIKEIAIRNFRILSDSKMELDRNPCLMIGRNNAGKTSFMVLIEKFLRNQGFDYNDFPIRLRKEILSMDWNTDETKLAIQLLLTIHYDETDNLRNLSDFIVDLTPGRTEVYLLFECGINKAALLRAAAESGGVDQAKFIRRHLSDYLDKRIYTFDDPSVMDGKREQMVEKKFDDVKKLIDFEIIHAKRSVASSEERNGRKVLSQLTTSYFNAENSRDAGEFVQINQEIEKMDQQLEGTYSEAFKDFLENAKNFLGLETLQVRSNLSAKEILEDASEVVYGNKAGELPENQNGLGHVNILYLLLSLKIKKRSFEINNKDIRLLFIEEPEAHTHPQLQYNFAEKIKELIGEDPCIQSIITTHSPHIVSRYPFEDLRYMAAVKDKEGFYNVQIKNFHDKLYAAYAADALKENAKKGRKGDVRVDEFQFLKQYLTIVSAELFFADKAIFIEGTSEKLMLPYFIARFDEEQRAKAAARSPEALRAYVPLAAQNIAIVEAGANAKVFRHFIDFLGIPTLVITDIDTVKKKKEGTKTKYPECKVTDPEACTTSNATIKYYLQAPEDIQTREFVRWFNRMRNYTARCCADNVHVSYQCLENGFRPRSFEDAFINVNLQALADHRDSISGLKNKNALKQYAKNGAGSVKDVKDIYDLTEKILSGKSGFAATLLYETLSGKVKWETPRYIKEGLEWLQKQTH